MVTQTDWRFELVEEPVPEPIVKRHDLVPELTGPTPQWDEGFVAVDDDRVIGVALLAFQKWNRREVLWGLFVDAAERRRGTGSALVGVAVERGRSNGARQLWLETQNTNVPAVRAYRAMGFALVGLDQTLYDGAVADETALFFARSL